MTKPCQWLRFHCNACGEYHATLPVEMEIPKQCVICEGPVDLIAKAKGQTRGELPEIHLDNKKLKPTAGYYLRGMSKKGNRNGQQ